VSDALDIDPAAPGYLAASVEATAAIVVSACP
jgi:hypothetical protein